MEHCPKLLRFDVHIGLYMLCIQISTGFMGATNHRAILEPCQTTSGWGGDLSTLFNSELPSPKTQQIPGAPPCGWVMNQPHPSRLRCQQMLHMLPLRSGQGGYSSPSLILKNIYLEKKWYLEKNMFSLAKSIEKNDSFYQFHPLTPIEKVPLCRHSFFWAKCW